MTRYDAELKKKFPSTTGRIFVLKGDESYTRTTDTILNLVEYDDSSILNMKYDLELNVLRDIGESNLVVYDGEEVLYSIEWSDTPSEISFPDNMTWDGDKLIISDEKFEYELEHDIYAKYMGSNQCLKSESEHYKFNMPTPDKFASTIVNTGKVSFDVLNTYFTISARVNFSSPVEIARPYAIDMYIDDSFYHTYEGTITKNDTALNRNMYVNQTGMPTVNQGKHHVKLVYRGDDYTSSSELEFDISLGYTTTITDYSKVFVPAQQLWYTWNTVTVQVKDYLDNPIDTEVALEVTNAHAQSVTAYLNGDTYDGEITFELIDYPYARKVLMQSANVNLLAYTTETEDEYDSETINVPVYANAGVTVTASKDIVAPNIQSTISAKLDTVYEGLPVDFGEYGLVYTDSEGVASFTYNGEGNGNKNIFATVGSEIMNYTTIHDYLQYWNVSSNTFYNQKADLWNLYWTGQTNQLLLRPVQYSRAYMYLVDDNKWLAGDCSWACEFDVMGVNYCVPFIQSQQFSTIKKGDKVRIVKYQPNSGLSTIRVYINNSIVTERTQNSESDGYPMIGIAPSNSSKLSSTNMGINNLKLAWYPVGTDPDGA